MENKSKVVIAIAIVVVVVLVGYWMMVKKEPVSEPAEGNSATGGPAAVETPQGAAAAPGASVVGEEGLVLTASGEVANNAAEAGTNAAPQQSAPITKAEAPATAVKIDISSSGISPAEFTAKAGAAVTLAVTSADTASHVFAFRDPSLQAVATGLAPGETRAITFNVPTKPGEYEFYCNVPGHPVRGEVGKMIVK